MNSVVMMPHWPSCLVLLCLPWLHLVPCLPAMCTGIRTCRTPRDTFREMIAKTQARCQFELNRHPNRKVKSAIVACSWTVYTFSSDIKWAEFKLFESERNAKHSLKVWVPFYIISLWSKYHQSYGVFVKAINIKIRLLEKKSLFCKTKHNPQ